jgi:pimeloyl-ACP methyl ester carboxylesterase
MVLDHRGHGRSTKTHDLAGYTIDQLVRDLVALLDAEGGGQVDLLGHSMGGVIALRVTLARPDLVRSLILMDTSAWSFRPEDPKAAAAVAGFLDSLDPARGLPDVGDINPVEDALIAARTPKEWQEEKETLSAAFDPYAMKGLGQELFSDRLSVRDRLGEIACPVTVIVGANDQPLAGQAPELAAAIADAQLAVIPDAFHSPQLTHPAEWREAVLAHLARVGAGVAR